MEKPLAQVSNIKHEGFQLSAHDSNTIEGSLHIELAKKCIQVAKLGDI